MPDTDDHDPYAWHDDTLYGLRFALGDSEAGDWRAGLVLDIDHIVAWQCGEGGRPRFRVAPATLVFHDVTDLRIAVDWGDSGHQVALHACAIDRIERQRIEDQKICLDRPYWRWTIVFGWPKGSVIAFGASALHLALRAAPILQDQQQLQRRPD